MHRRRAFTLMELLITIILTGIIMGAVLSLFFSVFKNYDFHQDITEAKQTGIIALASMQPFVLNAGLGMPAEESEFSDRSFRWGPNASDRLPVIFPDTSSSTKNFYYFIQPAMNASDRSPSLSGHAPALWVVYAMPSGIRIIEGNENFVGVMSDTAVSFDSAAFNQALRFSGSVDAQRLAFSTETKKPSTLKHWVVFPASTPPHPFTVDSASSTEITLRSHSNQSGNSIVPQDELHYVRAAKIFVQNGELIIDHLDGSGAQSVVNNIAGMWCSFDPDDRVLTVRILARAGTMREEGVQSELEGWPAEAEAFWKRDVRYRHAVVSRSWRIRN